MVDIELPSYKTEGSSGMDLRANITSPVIIKPMERYLVPTGLIMEIPTGYEGQIRARSGLAIKNGITLINAIGTVDSDYRGEIKIPIINLGTEPFTIEKSDRIAQLVIMKIEKAKLNIIDSDKDLTETIRGQGGFGHSGIE